MAMFQSRRLFLLLAASTLTASCVSITPDATQSADIGPSDGLLLARFHTYDSNGTLAIHQGFASLPYAGFAIGAQNDLKLIKIRANDGLRFSTFKVGDRMAYFDRDKVGFNIKPRTITYVGDVHIMLKQDHVYIRIEDREAETKRLAMEKFPALFSSFGYVKSLAGQ